ncbi:MAG: hypothetical protein ACOZCO_06670 [Bacteroidota bacterium]
MVTIIKEGSQKKTLMRLMKRLSRKRGFSSGKYAGIIKLRMSPVKLQKQWRDEWE